MTPDIIHSEFGREMAQLEFGDTRKSDTFRQGLAIDNECTQGSEHEFRLVEH